MWHKVYIGGGYEYGPGRAPKSHYTEGWGVPCLVFERDGTQVTRYTRDAPDLVNPKEFIGLFDEKEQEYTRIDAEQKARNEARAAEKEEAKRIAKAIGDILSGLGVEGMRVHAGTYASEITIPEPALKSMLSALTEPEAAAQKKLAEYQVEVDKKANAVIDANNVILETALANNKQIILDLLYELDVTWDEYFSGQEVEAK